MNDRDPIPREKEETSKFVGMVYNLNGTFSRVIMYWDNPEGMRVKFGQESLLQTPIMAV